MFYGGYPLFLYFFVYEIEFLTYTIFDDCKYEDDLFEEIFTNE